MDLRLERLAAAWLATRASENTRAAYGRDLAAYASWCGDAGVDALRSDASDLDAYRDACLAGGASSATVSRRLSALASFFRHAEATGSREGNPADGVERPHARGDRGAGSGGGAQDGREQGGRGQAGRGGRGAPGGWGAQGAQGGQGAPGGRGGQGQAVLDEAELAALLDAADQLGPKTAALVALLGREGIKLNEVLALDVPRVRRRGTSVSVAVDRRGQRRELPITARTAAVVTAYVASRRRGPLFLGDSAVEHAPARLTRFGADFLIKRAGAAASLGKPVSANVLRRSYVGAAHRAGTPLADIAQQIGHRDRRETARLLDGGT